MANSDYTVHGILDAIFNATAFNLAGNPYISLHTGDPGTTGANEVAGGSYARVQVPFNAAASRSVKNTSSFSFTSMPAATITHIGVWSALSGGNFIAGGPLSVSIPVAALGTVTIAAEKVVGSG